MKSHNQNAYFSIVPQGQAGFTLVEIMVGLTIGMLATLVILQVFSVFESQKRTTTGTADALVNGNIGLYKIQRDLQQASYGLIPLTSTNSPYKCADPITSDPTLAASGVDSIAAFSLVDGTSDEITVRYGTSPFGGVAAPVLTPDAIAGPSDATLKSTLGCARGDVTLAVNGTACTLSYVTAIVRDSVSNVAGVLTLHDATNAVPNSANLVCLGPSWRVITYKVDANTNTLVRRDSKVSATFEPSVADIVNIQAQYGISGTPTSNQITQWVDPTGSWAPASITINDRNRVKAIRVALVARDAKMEVNNVTSTCNVATNTGLCAWQDSASSPAPTIDLSAIANWQKYHYRVFEMIIPIRNVVWSKSYL